MSLEDFIIWMYCCVEEMLAEVLPEKRLRARGFAPGLSDAEVITMELVGEFLGYDTDTGIWGYFRSHWRDWFPALGSRSQFAKQSLNLWALKQQLEQRVKQRLGTLSDPVHLVDGFPIPVSHIKRAPGCQRFRGEASYGYCASKEEYYYGFEGHVLLDFHGAIADFTLTPACESEREAVWEMLDTTQGGLLLGDKGYLGAFFESELVRFKGIELQTPRRRNMTDPLPKTWRKRLNKLRRRVETTISQLSERFHIQRTWARTLWSLTNRITRKLLAFNLAIVANRLLGNEPLQLHRLIQA